MVIASLESTHAISTSIVLSSDLWTEFYGTESVSSASPNYVKLTLPSYNKWHHQALISHCDNDDSLPFGSAGLPTNFIKQSQVRPMFSSIEIEPYVQQLPNLDNLVLSLNPDLFNELNQLSKEEQRKFLTLRFNLLFGITVLNVNQVVYPAFCKVTSSSNDFGILTDQTQIVLVPDSNVVEQSRSNDEFTEFDHLFSLHVKIQSLLDPVPVEFLSPPQPDTTDNDLFAFVQPNILLQLGVPSGTFVRVIAEEQEMLVQLFVLFAPNEYECDSLYVSPRVRYVFMNHARVIIQRPNLALNRFSVSNAVTLSRIGCQINAQRRYQDIISHHLALYFSEKQRIVKVGDLIPITFDSNYASMFTDDIRSGQHDTLVWFKVEEIESDSNEEYHIIDSSITRLSTVKITSRELMPKSICDYDRFYNLSPLFHYDEDAFPFAKRLKDILNTAIKCSARNVNVGTSIMLHSSSPNVGKTMLTRSVCAELGFHLIHVDCLSLTSNSNTSDATNKTIGYIRAKIETIISYVEKVVIFLSHLETILEDEQNQQDNTSSKMARQMNVEMADLIEEYTTKYKGTVFVGSTNDIDNIPAIVRSRIKFEIDVPVPTEKQRLQMFRWYFDPYVLNSQTPKLRSLISHNVPLQTVSVQSAGLTPMDIRSIVKAVKYKCYQRLKQNDLLIDMTDITAVINIARDRFSDSIGAPKIPNVTWDDIGGMDVVKGEIMDTIDMPLKHPELFSSGMKKRSGILFYGPPGTGKTLLAKAIASNFSLNFFSVKGPELLNMYIGESEANVRRVFQKARDAKPCVIFFDELDSVAPKRGNQGDSGGVMDRIVSQLLAELDGMSSGGDGVFVIGATNRPDLLDEALLRPGRFDKMLYLGISDTDKKQANIIKALTRKFTLESGIDILDIAKKCPFNYTGADFYALCSDALLNAMTRVAGEVDEKWEKYNMENKKNISLRYWFDNVANENDLKVVVKLQDFELAQQNLIPSVSEDELRHYLRLKSSFESQ
ncbi:AAA family ATPase peroxin 6 [Kluyveromyces lactis]|uniref:Peroxisomal ATPase PEX6 n=2 Tax=Kluyveromyces lactis TaxID=28985 RepID=PEX6_KLULA|nr:uncharacterized protein KLLA0_E02003g [Kluyveromyces lactis]Q6CPV1.1 RecName: Full=Peroxisomal ATPase PEX6; AltName: Full=Peroxin-6; AltName: Full=Peroxisomal biogenesis factor 6 [Kluyveromyces lactis NRRL Y-1140]CAG99125.1 KLLA0E02003p [Kluyveromyces lactis]|eukprot:XP_454038.1 uncharacterized protein KLLA0_E02003g [Kluyveromyces lactis]